jgi:DNA-binding NarL/FixJ family response regulator
MISVVLVDDHPLIVEGIRRMIELNAEFEVTAVANDGDSVLPLLATTRCDVLVLDVGLPGMNSFDLLKRVKSDFPTINVVVFSASAEEQYGVRMVRAGASAYLSKSRHGTDLITAISRAAKGQRYLTDTLADQLIAREDDSGKSQLTKRELEVLRLLVDGHQPLSISQLLEIGPTTVSTHLANLREKLNARSNHELVRVAVVQGLVD